jgi:hypothetical protein
MPLDRPMPLTLPRRGGNMAPSMESAASGIEAPPGPLVTRKIRFLIGWLLASAAGSILGSLPWSAVVVFWGKEHNEVLLLAPAVHGLIAGTFQWLVIRKLGPNTMAWIPLTVFGAVVSAAVFFMVFPPLANELGAGLEFATVAAWLVSSASIGAAQWPVLLPLARRSWAWIAAYGGAGALAAAVQSALPGIVPPEGERFFDLEQIGSWAHSGAVSAMIIGPILGLTLISLQKKRNLEPEEVSP